MFELRNYVIQCKDKKTGRVGSFLIDPKKPRYEFKRGEYDAESPIFDNIVLLFKWAIENKIELHH